MIPPVGSSLSQEFFRLRAEDPLLKDVFPKQKTFRHRGLTAELSRWLREYNLANGMSSHAHILSQLQSSEQHFVVTGQQPGLLGGPLLTLYKAQSCIAWAKKYSIEHGKPVLPLFWIAGDDSDLKEVNRLDASGMRYFLRGFSREHESLMVSHRNFDKEQIRKLTIDLEKTSISKDWMKFLPENGNFSSSFSAVLGEIFGDDLLLLDPSAPGFEKFSQPFLRKILGEYEKLDHALEEGQKFCQVAGIRPSVRLRKGNPRLFIVRDNVRIRPKAVDVLALLQNEKLVLSHDVLTRPLLCNHLLPVVCHVLGPAELRYFALLGKAHQLFGLDFPALEPRCHASFIRKSDKDFLDTVGLVAEDLGKTRRELQALLGMEKMANWKMKELEFLIPSALERLRLKHPDFLLRLEKKGRRESRKLFLQLKVSLHKSDREESRSLSGIVNRTGGSSRQERLSMIPFLGSPQEVRKALSLLDPLEPGHQLRTLATRKN